jgi:hypothetical protein
MKPSEYAKATVGALAAGLTALGTAVADDGVTGAEWVGVAVAVVGAFATVFAVPNADPLAPPRRRHGAEAGRGDVLYILAVVFVAILIVVAVVSLIEGRSMFG